MEDFSEIRKQFKELSCCVVIPTYNNQKTIAQVLEGVLQYTHQVLVVVDGATDKTPEIIQEIQNKQTEPFTLIQYHPNQGKGMALRTAFKKALELGYRYVLTIDSDGQHFPSDFHLFLEKIKENPDSLIMGSRNLNIENVPGKNSFGNKFSNFWFLVETGMKLPDTQTGYRLYPIKKMQKMRFFTARFEFEVEVIVKAAWKGILILPIPIQVYYAKGDERVTHFRPFKDFFRISLLNTYLVTLAFLWYKPLKVLKGLNPRDIKAFFVKHFFDWNESIIRKSTSVAVGIFFGIVPIWGYQLVSAIAAAYLLKLNKAIVILSANISMPLMIPAILMASVETGEWVTGVPSTFTLSNITLETVKSNLYVYLVGASVLSVLAALAFGIATYVVLSLVKPSSRSNN